jgi:hypothetical protein
MKFDTLLHDPYNYRIRSRRLYSATTVPHDQLTENPEKITAYKLGVHRRGSFLPAQIRLIHKLLNVGTAILLLVASRASGTACGPSAK